MNKMNKLAMIVLALVVSFVTNVKGEDVRSANYAEPTGGKAVLTIPDQKDVTSMNFKLVNGTTPGEWKCKLTLENGKGKEFVFLEGPFKGQKYIFGLDKDGTTTLTEQEGRKTVWTMVP
jgi:hypothetical protein